MKIAVMGAGAVGCYYGFKLARVGHDVLGRDAHDHEPLGLVRAASGGEQGELVAALIAP